MSVRIYYLILMILFNFLTSESYVVSIDSSFLNSLFNQVGQFSVIKTGFPDTILNEDINKQKLIRIPAFYNEQCLVECLKNPNCVRYSFNSTQSFCRIYLSVQRRKFTFDQKTAAKLKDLIDLDLESCVNDVYCTDMIEKKILSGNLCDPINTYGEKCQNKVTYELSSWSQWTSCSLTCDQGFRRRERFCLRSYFDNQQSKTVQEVTNYESMCQIDNTKTIELQQVEGCTVRKCLIHSEWSAWSSCNKICDGFQNRKRNCLIDDPNNIYCSSLYLNEQQSCGFNNCSLLVLGLDEGKKNSTGPLLNGVLTFYNSDIDKPIRIFSLTDDSTKLSLIGRIACNELGYKGLSWISAAPIDHIKTKYSTNVDYLNYVKSNFYGLECDGTEKNVRDCIVASNITYEQKLYELYTECYVNGYWSQWGSWGACSASCGSGVRTRTRACNDPPPTITDKIKGLACPASGVDLEQCTRPRCDQNAPPSPS